MKTWRAIPAAVVVATAAAGAQTPGAGRRAPAPDPHTAHTIQLDAIVTDAHDRPIRDLTRADFEITDKGEPRPIDTAVLNVRKDGRLIAIFADEYHIRAGDEEQRVRAAMSAFVDHELREGDELAIVKPLDSLGSIRLTHDREAFHAAIDAFHGRSGDYAPRTEFEANYISRQPEAAEVSRNQIVSAALQALAVRIGAIRDGRKTILLISNGFSAAAPRTSDRLLGSQRAIVYAANSAEVAIYAIAPGGESGGATATIEHLADQTGGRATVDRADLLSSMREAVADVDNYYRVGYTPATVGDGTFHAVQLRVKRPGAQVRVRTGYWAADPKLFNPLPSQAARKPSIPIRPTHASALIAPWIGTARLDDAPAVIVTWTPGAPPPRNQQLESVSLKAMDLEGHVLFDGIAKGRTVFAASPGVITLEMTIHGERGVTLDTDYRMYVVPPTDATRPSFASVQVLRTRNAREFSAAAHNPDAPPVSSRAFSRAERLLLRVPLYGVDPSATTVTATLMNRAGQPMRQLRHVEDTTAADQFQFDLPLSSLAPDEYHVVFAAVRSGESPDAPLARALMQFRVVD
jgi:VWFA-related protein